jgi:hypothetical protein
VLYEMTWQQMGSVSDSSDPYRVQSRYEGLATIAPNQPYKTLPDLTHVASRSILCKSNYVYASPNCMQISSLLARRLPCSHRASLSLSRLHGFLQASNHTYGFSAQYTTQNTEMKTQFQIKTPKGTKDCQSSMHASFTFSGLTAHRGR